MLIFETEKAPSLYGLVLAGGKSTRMKTDKSVLEYHGKKQVEHGVILLSQFCKRVFISNRKDQYELPGHKNYPQIHDMYTNLGPLGGILSAMSTYPHKAWLVLACDLPNVNGNVLANLIAKRDLTKMATAYQSAYNDSPEPLCAIYEPKITPFLFSALSEGMMCPRKILLKTNIRLIRQIKQNTLDNINSPEDYHAVINDAAN